MGKRFEKCVLHIGTEKTGTTTLQAFLAVNRQLLVQQGFFVPASLSPYTAIANHERLTTVALDVRKINDDVRRSVGIATEADVALHRGRVATELRREVGQLADEPSILVLSNEHCHSRLIAREEVQFLHDFLAEFSDSFEIIVYLRPQHELAISLYDQALKVGYADISILPDFTAPGPRWVEKRYFDYNDLLSRWQEVFGHAALKPVIFSRDRLLRASIIDDFLARIGCEFQEFTRPKDRNTSISADLQVVLNSLNRFAKSYPERLPPQVRSKALNVFQKLSVGRGRRPTRTQAYDFYTLFAESNEAVRRDFFADRATLFDVDFSELPLSKSEFSEVDLLDDVLIKVLSTQPS